MPIDMTNAAADIRTIIERTPKSIVGGLAMSAIDRAGTAELILQAARTHRPGDQPLVFSSANGEVLARAATEPAVAALFARVDHLVADGQPLVVASRRLCKVPLPERVATTDLFHDVAERAERNGDTFYFFGATEAENARAVAAVAARYPKLRIVGRSHGYLEGAALERALAEINALAPDVLWLALGVPREQRFALEHGPSLGNVGVIKTSGGLFNFLSGTKRRAPAWMQRASLEWLWRAALEPSRLLVRYLTTNPVALYLLLTRSR